ncbi:MAG TPA: phosphotransferase family protein [Gammaproteobacteria bacterium]|nr:phosphotransferase family protein [Gammaproteobacteria bacterium]
MHARLERVLANVFTDFESLEIVERLSGGASQETYRIELTRGGKPAVLALRRASGGIEGEVTAAHPGLAVEALLMQAAAQAGVPEPKVHYVLRSEDGVGAGFIMQWLDGFTLGAQIVKTPELAEIRPQLARRCGEVLAQIHGIDLVASGLDQHLQHQSAEEYVRQTWQRYQDFNTPQPMIDFTARWLLDHLPENTTPALVHNDFRNGNVMIDVSGIVAVLDWEVAYIGDPMRDLGWILTHSWRFGRDDLPVGGFGEVADLFAGYESVSGTSVDPEAVRFWQIFGSFWWSVGCLGMAEHYRNGPDKTVERPAVGRRSSECQVDCVNLLIPGSVVLEQPQTAATAMPGMDELLTSVSDFLRDDVMAHTQGRLQFLARVAANSLDIVKREQTLAAPCLVNEEKRLRELFSEREDSTLALDDLRWRLVYALRDGSMVLDSELLHAHLRATVVNQIAIDQPRYAGFKTATSEANTT